MQDARPLAGAWLVLGTHVGSTPFKGGTLVPAPDLAFGPFVVDGVGGLTLGSTWPAAAPPGVTFFVQAWIADPAAPRGFAASNAVSGTTPF